MKLKQHKHWAAIGYGTNLAPVVWEKYGRRTVEEIAKASEIPLEICREYCTIAVDSQEIHVKDGEFWKTDSH